MSNRENDPDWWQCPRCEDWFHRQYDRERQWTRGPYRETTPDGVSRTYDHLCTDCHRELGYR